MKKDILKDNFYEAINHEWMEKTVIPDDQPAISAFVELHLDIEKTLMDLTKKWSENPDELPDNLKKFVKLYRMTSDFEQREKLGVKPFSKILDRIDQLSSLKDLENNLADLMLDSIDVPLGFGINEDFMNSQVQVLYFSLTDLFLPDTSYYHDEKTKEQLLGLFKATTSQLLTLYGFSQEKTEKLIAEAIAFDALLVPLTKSSVEKADYVKLYNPFKKEDIQATIKHIDIMRIAETLVKQPVDQLIVTSPAYVNQFDQVINEENFELIKSWMIVSNAMSFASMFTDEIRIAGGAFGRALTGTQAAQSKEKFAFYQAYRRFSQVVGLYYGETYFGPVAKEDVKNMVHEMIRVYHDQLANNTWLKDSTKQKALKKLSTLTVHVGYPDELPSYYDAYEIKSYEEGFDLVQQRIALSRVQNAYEFKKYKQAPNRNLWGMAASDVNAYYNPFHNQIVFPAAILQAPYYSIKQTPSENFGGIGAVIAHEISHAFDNNGAKFDEFGSLNNWWTEEDKAAFGEKTKAMIALFDKVETGYGPCNGELTVSENIADSGGLRCALEASKRAGNHQHGLFFENWARVWRQKAANEYNQLLLRVDVHGPCILRANMQLSNLPEFQQFYGLSEADKMYLPAEKMISIW